MGALAEFERNLTRERERERERASPSRASSSEAARQEAGAEKEAYGERLAGGPSDARDETFTVAEVADRVGVSPATLYGYMPGGRGAAA